MIRSITSSCSTQWVWSSLVFWYVVAFAQSSCGFCSINTFCWCLCGCLVRTTRTYSHRKTRELCEHAEPQRRAKEKTDHHRRAELFLKLAIMEENVYLNWGDFTETSRTATTTTNILVFSPPADRLNSVSVIFLPLRNQAVHQREAAHNMKVTKTKQPNFIHFAN